MTLTDFLLARIAEDEDIAWIRNEYEDPSGADERFTHERQRAECAAKRRIVLRCSRLLRLEGSGQVAQVSFGGGMDTAFDFAAQPVLRILATVYANHPDYLEEWRP